MKKINKAIDTGLDDVLNNGLKVRVEIPTTTLFATSATVIFTALVIITFSKYIKHFTL